MRHKQRHFAPAGYIPKFYAYARVSHKRQFDKGDSIESQETRIKAYFEMKRLEDFSPLKEAIWGGVFAEPLAQSAYAKPFPSRPAGKLLYGKLQPGDHLAVDKFDRIFRDLEDFAVRRRWFKERGIKLHIVNFMGLCLDADSRGGDLMLSIFATLAEAESMQISQRVTMARAARRAAGKHDGGTIPYLCKCVNNAEGKKRGGQLVFQEWAEPLMEKMTYLREKEQLSWDRVAQAITKVHHDKHLNNARCRELYGFWKQWNKMGRPDLNTIRFMELSSRWWLDQKALTEQAKAAKAQGPNIFGANDG